MTETTLNVCGLSLPVHALDALIIGSGCAGLNAADWLFDLGRRDVAIITEGMNMGTSRNTGSDKQTYYKLSIASDGADSVREMAETLLAGGSVNGDTALCEAAGSLRCFMKLANLGVPFPTNEFGEYIGYKTDHDPRQRATSAGPLTSKLMTEALEASVRRKGIRIFDRFLAAQLLTENGKIQGVLAVNLDRKTDKSHGFTLFCAKNVILATGGPADVYADSVYPCGHTGMTGMALSAGARAVNLHEWQYGLASVDFRWNVSGTYQQVLPRYLSIDEHGVQREFLPDYFDTPQAALDAVFLKGYQWPFDVRKVRGSSVIDLIIHHETADLGRRVYMDFMHDPCGLNTDFSGLAAETYDYLAKSGALLPTPIARLKHMNPDAIALYAAHGIDITREPLRVAVCAQHCNGGIAVDANWQTDICGLYAVGELAGTFGTYRPGGSALNSTQVGSMRAAQHIACETDPVDFSEGGALPQMVQPWLTDVLSMLSRASDSSADWMLRASMRRKMSDSAALLREEDTLRTLSGQANAMIAKFTATYTPRNENGLLSLLKTRDTLLTQAAMLSAMVLSAQSNGSRGAGLVRATEGEPVSAGLSEYKFVPERTDDGSRLLETVYDAQTGFSSCFAPVRPYPEAQDWFETAWREFKKRTARLRT